jgi:hypothetical protein
MPPSKPRRPWSALSDSEKIARLERHLEATRGRVYELEGEFLEYEQRLRMLFRELGLQDRRLRPLIRELALDEEPAQLKAPIVDSIDPAPERG